jgi:hypothetical protein
MAEELVAKCGKTSGFSGLPFNPRTLAQHEQDCAKCNGTYVAPAPIHAPSEIPQRGWWYELYDGSDRDYGSDWGYVLYFNGKEVERVCAWTRIGDAGDAGREAKRQAIDKQREKLQKAKLKGAQS